MNHKTVETVVPVMIARYGVDGFSIAFIGQVEFVQVFVDISSGVDDIAADDHKGRTFSDRVQKGYGRKLRPVSLPGISNDEELERIEIRAINNEALQDVWTFPLCTHPATAFVVNRVTQVARDHIVAALPKHFGLEPTERRLNHPKVEGHRIPAFLKQIFEGAPLLAAPSRSFKGFTGAFDLWVHVCVGLRQS